MVKIIGMEIEKDVFVSVGGGIRRFFSAIDIEKLFEDFAILSLKTEREQLYQRSLCGDPHVFGIIRTILRKDPVEIINEDLVSTIDLRAAVFDFDGTVTDTQHIWTELERTFYTDAFLESGATDRKPHAIEMAEAIISDCAGWAAIDRSSELALTRRTVSISTLSMSKHG